VESYRRLLWGALPLMVLTTSLVPALASAESPPTVAQARELFSGALKDEEAGRFADALTKLLRVQSVRDTSPVRYQIAKCTENVGRIAKARELYLRTVDGTQIPSNEDPSVAIASRESAGRLAGRVGYVRIDGKAANDAERLVSIDDDEWAGAGLREVDPGTHVLRVQDSDDGATRTVSVTVNSGATASVKLFTVDPAPVKAVVTTVKPKPTSSSGAPTAWTWVSLGAGAAFLGGGIAMLAVREGTIGSIEDLCPGNRCATVLEDDIGAKQSRARTLGVLGITATALGGAGLAVGAGLFLFGPRSGGSSKSASAQPRPGTLSGWSQRSGVAPLPGGAQLLVGAAF